MFAYCMLCVLKSAWLKESSWAMCFRFHSFGLHKANTDYIHLNTFHQIKMYGALVFGQNESHLNDRSDIILNSWKAGLRFWIKNQLRPIGTFVLCSQSSLNLHQFCLTR